MTVTNFHQESSSDYIKDKKTAGLSQCLQLLRPCTSDEQKFAGLLLLPRILVPGDDVALVAVFHAIDFAFIDRLLKNDLTSTQQVPTWTIRSIAIHILSSFAYNFDLASSLKLTQRITSLLHVLCQSTEHTLSLETLQLLIKLTVSPTGILEMLQPGVFSMLADFSSDPTRSGDLRALSVQLQTHISSRALDRIFQTKAPILPNLLQKGLSLSLDKLSHTLAMDRTIVKFEVLDAMVQLLGGLPDESMRSVVNGCTILGRNARSGIHETLKSKLAQDWREKSIMLSTYLSRCLGGSWLFAMDDPSLDKTFSFVVIQVACIEVQVTLDRVAAEYSRQQMAENMLKGKGKALDVDDENLAVQETHNPLYDLQQTQTILSVCYELLEHAIAFLAQLADEEGEEGEPSEIWKLLDIDALMKIRSALSKTSRCVLEYLDDVKNESQDPVTTILDNPIHLASLRFLCTWLAEDETMHADVEEMIPLFEDLAASGSVEFLLLGLPLIRQAIGVRKPN